MSEQQNEPQVEQQNEPAPPQVEPIAAREPPEDAPDTNPETVAAVGEPDGKSVDASEDPNLGHALEDQAQGVGIGPTQTSAQGEGSDGEGDDVAGAI